MVMNNRCDTCRTKETTPIQHTAKEPDTHPHIRQREVKHKQTAENREKAGQNLKLWRTTM